MEWILFKVQHLEVRSSDIQRILSSFQGSDNKFQVDSKSQRNN